MPIRIEEVRKMVFTAEVTPPDGGAHYWKTPHPMDMRELILALKALGCTQDDISHAFDELGEAQYRQMAAVTEPVVREALAGTRKIPTQRPDTEAWLGYALCYYSRLLTLQEVIESADAVNHLIPSPDEVALAFVRLKERGWLEVQGDKYGLTEEGRMVIEMQVNDGAVPRVAKWMAEHPAPATETWVRRYLENEHAKSD